MIGVELSFKHVNFLCTLGPDPDPKVPGTGTVKSEI
jgi:hypothetical protein